MEKYSLALPSMFGDHHVVEVRRILTALPGVARIYASSGFQVVEVDFDPEQLDKAQIQAALLEAGYLEAELAPVEIHKDPTDRDGPQPYFRHTADFPNIEKTIGFKQDVAAPGRPLWPCPGLPLTAIEKEVDHG